MLPTASRPSDFLCWTFHYRPIFIFFNRKKNIWKKNFIRIYIGYINQSLFLHIFAGCGECSSGARTHNSSSFTRTWPVPYRGRASFEPRISNANGYVLFIISVPFGTYLYYEPFFYTISCLVGKHLTVSAWNRRGSWRTRTFDTLVNSQLLCQLS